jgi:carbamoyltransferase
MSKKKPVYVLGTGLSHNGSAVLLKDGSVAFAIEKERVSRKKHEGGNDNAAIEYCLQAEGISLKEVSVVVQTANFEIPERAYYKGARMLADYPDVPLYSISHHLAHAYSTIGTCPYEAFNIMVVDGCGSPYDQCMDFQERSEILDATDSFGMKCEKDSFYHYDGREVHTILKDFSEMAPFEGKLQLPTTRHSIGGFYAAISHYCFGNMDDAGKLMGLAAFGQKPALDKNPFTWVDDRLTVNDGWKDVLCTPAESELHFKKHFQYYADVALWAQEAVEKAIVHLFSKRNKLRLHEVWAYSGGVALNAVANGKLLKERVVEKLYIEPAAGDNGLALGCAYYGWLKVLNRARVTPSKSTCFGKEYKDEISTLLKHDKRAVYISSTEALVSEVAQALQAQKTVGWFQLGAEFGPRALGRRSILASPLYQEMQTRINRDIKFREDFRPFAPAVPEEDVKKYFVHGFHSPYMILVDEVKDEWRPYLQAVSHKNGSARVQTVDNEWNPLFHQLLKAFEAVSGVGVLLNTSFNRKGEPMVETPQEALTVFDNTALDVLVLGNWVVRKNP